MNLVNAAPWIIILVALRYRRAIWRVVASNLGKSLVALVVVGSMAAGVVWPPGSAEAQSEELIGPQTSPGANISCRATIGTPPGYTAGQTNMENFTYRARCYIEPQSGPFSIQPFGTVSREVSGNMTTNFVAPWGVCAYVAEDTNWSEGRFGIYCRQEEGFSNNGAAVRVGIDGGVLPTNNKVLGFPEYGGSDADGMPFTAMTWDQANEVDLLPPPAWPQWWPEGATEVDYGPETALPTVRCRVELREYDGQVYGDFRAGIPGARPANSTDSFEWAFEWDDGVYDPRSEPSASDWWEDRETVLGAEQLGVPVPLSGAPTGGWWVAVKVRRTFTGMVHTRSWNQTLVARDVELKGGTVTFPGGEFPSWWSAGMAAPTDKATFYDLLGAEVIDDHTVAWQEVSVPCMVTAEPERAGHPSGDRETTIVPPFGGGSPYDERPDETPVPPGTPDHCEAPSGWNLINPVQWVETVACGIGDALGPLLRWLGDLLGGLLGEIVDLLGGLLAGIAALFIPDDLSYDWEGVRTKAAGKAPLAAAPFVADSWSALSGSFDKDGDDCLELGVPGVEEECLELQTGSIPGVDLLRLVFIGALWVGVGAAVLQTAPWSKGRYGAEIGG